MCENRTDWIHEYAKSDVNYLRTYTTQKEYTD